MKFSILFVNYLLIEWNVMWNDGILIVFIFSFDSNVLQQVVFVYIILWISSSNKFNIYFLFKMKLNLTTQSISLNSDQCRIYFKAHCVVLSTILHKTIFTHQFFYTCFHIISFFHWIEFVVSIVFCFG